MISPDHLMKHISPNSFFRQAYTDISPPAQLSSFPLPQAHYSQHGSYVNAKIETTAVNGWYVGQFYF